MAGGHGHHGKIPDEEVPYCNRSIQDVIIKDL